jgi:hypothetical protein
MDLDKFLRNANFPTQEMMEDTLLKLQNESVGLDQLSTLTQDECEEIGLSADAFECLMTAVKVRVKHFFHSC